MRPTRDEICMDIAEVISKRGTCTRMQVGVVIAQQGRILVTGYNGAPAGANHCKHVCNCGGAPSMILTGGHDPECYSQRPCLISVHAEANAIAYAARWGINIEGAELFTTLSPCRSCAQLIVASGITRVISLKEYRDRVGLEILQECGVTIG